MMVTHRIRLLRDVRIHGQALLQTAKETSAKEKSWALSRTDPSSIDRRIIAFYTAAKSAGIDLLNDYNIRYHAREILREA